MSLGLTAAWTWAWLNVKIEDKVGKIKYEREVQSSHLPQRIEKKKPFSCGIFYLD